MFNFILRLKFSISWGGTKCILIRKSNKFLLFWTLAADLWSPRDRRRLINSIQEAVLFIVDISRFEFFNYLIKISHEIWSHYNTEFRPYNTLLTRVVQSNRNRAKLGRALHKLRSSFAVNPRYKFHHFFEPFLLLKLLVFAKFAHKLQRVYRDEYTTELSYDFIVVNRTIFQ